MTLVAKLKALCKISVRSGKIIYLGPNYWLQKDEDFTLFRKQLAPIEWWTFEEMEFLFRKRIALNKVNYGDFCGCNESKNFYSRHHDRFVNKIVEFIKENNPWARISSNFLGESILSEFIERIKQIIHRKRDRVILNCIQRQCTIVEITVCYDLYLENAYQEKVRRYKELYGYLQRNGFLVQLIILCFGSLGCVKGDVWKGLRSSPKVKKYKECDEVVFNIVYNWRKPYLEEHS